MSDISKKLHTHIISRNVFDRIVLNAFRYGYTQGYNTYLEQDVLEKTAIRNARRTMQREEEKDPIL